MHFNKTPLTNEEYETIYKVSVISGFFENNNDLKNKSINFLINYIFSIEKSNGINLNLCDFVKIFNQINSEYAMYNKEFSCAFLFNIANLKFLINETINSNNYNFISFVISKCGESDVLYLHNDVTKRSAGKLHDEYINYNKNNKLSNDKMSFIEWVLKKKNFNNYVTKRDLNKKKINLFYKYYNDITVIKRLISLINESEKLSQYIFYNLETEKQFIKTKKINVSSIYSKRKYRTMNLMFNNKKNNYKITIEKLNYFYKNRYVSNICNKSNYLIALTNCEFGTCANLGASGAEYIYESYLDLSCQPFLIYDLKTKKR